MVVCNQTWNFGPQIDVILEPIVEFESMATINLKKIYFPDGRITADWYSGRVEIYEIVIELDNVKVIEDNAFDVEAFRSVHILKITLKELIKIESEAFNNLPHLFSFRIWSTDTG